MLDPIAIKTAIALAQDFSAKGNTLTPIPDTPLSTIVRCAPVMGIEAANATYDSLSALMIQVSRGEDHAAAIKQSADLASGAVRRTIDLTRNTVMPHIRRVIELHEAAMASQQNAPLPFDIDHYYVPEIYKLQQGRSYLEQWEDVPLAGSPGPVNFGMYSPDEIMKLAQLTDDGDFNNSMIELLGAQGGQGYATIADVLSGRIAVENVASEFSLPLAIIIKNIEMPKEGLQMALSQYNLNRTLVSNIAARKGLTLIRTLADALNNLVVYRGSSRAVDGIIRVNSEVYSAMLDKDFSIEALIGNEIIGRKYRGSELMKPEVIEELTAAYERDRAIRQTAHVANLKVICRNTVQNVLREDLKAISDAGEFVIEGDSFERAWGRLRGFCDKLYSNEFAHYEPSLVISAAICFVWYAHTDAARYIDIMFEIEKEQKKHKVDLPSAEIATLAGLQYICSWVVSMVGVSKDVE